MAAPAGPRRERRGKKCQPACKPGSVGPDCLGRDGHSSRAAVAGRLKQPTRATDLKTGPGARESAVPLLFGFAPGGVCLAVRVAASAVRSYRTFSPLPRTRGGLFSVALFPGVTPAGRYPAPCFHGARTFLSGWKSGATVRPADQRDVVQRPGNGPAWQTPHGARPNRETQDGPSSFRVGRWSSGEIRSLDE